MRKLAFLVLAISLVLCGCSDSRSGEEMMTKFSGNVALAGSIEMQADISADVGDKDFDFLVHYTRNGAEERVEIISPENIAGVTAIIHNGGASLHYEDLILAVGSITQNGVSPMSAITLAMTAVGQGNFSEVRAESDGENDMIAADFFVSDSQSITLYLNAQAIPRYITISENGKMVAECEILSFSMNLE